MATFTQQNLCEWFDEFNRKYFGNKLCRPTIGIDNARKRLGVFMVKNAFYTPTYIIKVSRFLDRPIKDVQNTLIHEMIHLWQQVTFGKSDHGETFKRKAAEINADSWNISRCNSIDGYKVSNANANKQYRVCIFKINGKFGKAVIADSKSGHFKHWLGSSANFSGVYFGYSRDPKLATYTCSRKSLTWHWMTEEEYNFLTTKLTPLENKVDAA